MRARGGGEALAVTGPQNPVTGPAVEGEEKSFEVSIASLVLSLHAESRVLGEERCRAFLFVFLVLKIKLVANSLLQGPNRKVHLIYEMLRETLLCCSLRW